MLFSANFFANEVNNKPVVKFGTEANKKLHPKVVACVSFASVKSAFAGYKAHREALIANVFGGDKLPNGVRKALDTLRHKVGTRNPEFIVSFKVDGCADLFHVVISGVHSFVSAPEVTVEDNASFVPSFGVRKTLEGEVIRMATNNGNRMFKIVVNSSLNEWKAYRDEEIMKDIQASDAFKDLEAEIANAPSKADEKDRIIAELKAEVAELKAKLAEKEEKEEKVEEAVEVESADHFEMAVNNNAIDAIWTLVKDDRNVELWNKYLVKKNGSSINLFDIVATKTFAGFENTFEIRANVEAVRRAA
ncbi:hypothetical protein DLC15_23735 [Salmonella enterica subsp. enterica serovar Telelkebir]|nr:hypothetical protein [Salmonella enterica subsp. enterica serovar Telelkebir]